MIYSFFCGIFILLDRSIACLAEGFEGDSDLEVSPVSLCPLPLGGPAWEGGHCAETPRDLLLWQRQTSEAAGSAPSQQSPFSFSGRHLGCLAAVLHTGC